MTAGDFGNAFVSTLAMFYGGAYGIILLLIFVFLFIYLAYMLVLALAPLLSFVFGDTAVHLGNRHLFLREKVTFLDFLTFRALLAFFKAKNLNVINAITGISMFGITIGTAALIIVLSVFNGFHELIDDLYAKFDPDIKITAERGKTLPYSEDLMNQIRDVDGVQYVTPTIENKVVMQYFDKQHIVTLKGVRTEFRKVSPVAGQVYEGEYEFSGVGKKQMAVLGGGVAYYLSANRHDLTHPIEIYAANDEGNPLLNMTSAFVREEVFPAGYFSVQKEYDDHFALVDYELAKKLFRLKDEVTAYEIRMKSGTDEAELQERLQAVLPENMVAKTRYQQHQTLFEVMQNEKLVAYLVLCLMLVVAGVNIVGSLSMIVLEKTKDIAILRSAGMLQSKVVNLFLYEGFMVGLIGGLAGAIIGFVFGFLQMNFGILKINGGDSFVVDAFPLKLEGIDFLIIFLTVFSLSILAAVYPAIKASRLNIVQALTK